MRKLAKQFSYTSNVVKGLKQGRLIGFPTANLKIVKPIKIKPGVYAATCKLGSKTYLGMAYYGPRYIFNNLQNNLEVFLFNFNQTIYQKKLTINLTHFVRPPVKLKNLSDIKKQLIKDQQSISDNQVVLVNKKDQIVGQTDLLSAHLGKGQLHQAISVLIFNSKKQLLLQKRSQYKPLWPLFWANSCCGNKRPGKSMYQFAKDRLNNKLPAT